MDVFTVVADYAGGTYLAQIEASDVIETAKVWPNCEAITEVAMALELPIPAGTPDRSRPPMVAVEHVDALTFRR